MREIKFRAWDFQKKEWASRYCDEIIGGLELPIHDYFKSNGREITRWDFQQYTGLKDKNGVEVYEDDVTNLGVVMWDDKELQFTIDGIPITGYDTKTYPLEVIGNIHENPELLGD